jgi:osmotically-inducible protein OsmY
MRSTKDIRVAVEDELAFDPLVDASSITVKNVSGVVALNGTVPSYPDYLAAAAAVQRVAGVRHVHNHLAVELPDGHYRDDVQLATAANNALASDVRVPGGIEATARNGNLRLTGTVRHGAQRAAAAFALGGLAGVRNIKNEIEIDYDAADVVDVTALVRAALDRSALILDDSDVLVDASGNVVTLSGTVRTWAEHDAVVGAAWMASGVYEVIDDLTVTG